MTKRLPLLWLTILLTSSCDYSAVRDEASEFYAIPIGSILILNNKITIPPGRVSVLMQAGAIRKHADIDFYRPNCKFELYSISEDARLIQPDQFEITKVIDENEYGGLQKTYYASRSMFVTDAPETITYATTIYLYSDSQPDVYRMTCKHWESIVDDRFLTINEMRKAMGEIFTLRIDY